MLRRRTLEPQGHEAGEYFLLTTGVIEKTKKRFVLHNDIDVGHSLIYEVCLKINGTGSINVLFYLTSKFYMSPSK